MKVSLGTLEISDLDRFALAEGQGFATRDQVRDWAHDLIRQGLQSRQKHFARTLLVQPDDQKPAKFSLADGLDDPSCTCEGGYTNPECPVHAENGEEE